MILKRQRSGGVYQTTTNLAAGWRAKDAQNFQIWTEGLMILIELLPAHLGGSRSG
jgi:hypothetical protein